MLDSLLSTYPDHSLTDDSWFLMAQIMDYRRNWQVEDSLYMKIVAMGEESVLADDALYRRAQLYEEKFSDKAKAMELYQDLITRFPGSLYVVDARKRFRSLRGDLSN
jgi:outer membrane protein assembly factor BamD (BamD/ComL family)